MRYDKVKTLGEVKEKFGAWPGTYVKSLRDDIVCQTGDSTVVEVSVDVGAVLCSTAGILDFSLVDDMVNKDHIPISTHSGLYIGKIIDTNIHVFNIDEYDLVPPKFVCNDGKTFPDMRISIEMCTVAVAHEKEIKTTWDIKGLYQDLKVMEMTKHTHGAPVRILEKNEDLTKESDTI